MGHAIVEQLQLELDTYLRDTDDFYRVLNQVLPRMYSLGDWPGLLFETKVTVGTSRTISLPENAVSVVFATVDNDPRPVWAIWHDYRMLGVTEGAGALYGLVDDGLIATKVPLNSDYHFVLEFRPVHTGESFDGTEIFYVTGDSWDDEQVYESLTATASSTLEQLTNAALKRFHTIAYKNVSIDVEVTAQVVEVGTCAAASGFGTVVPITDVTKDFTETMEAGSITLFDLKADPAAFGPSTYTVDTVSSTSIAISGGPSETILSIPCAMTTNKLDTNSIVVGRVDGQNVTDGVMGGLSYRVFRVAEAVTDGDEVVRMLLKRKHKRITKDEDVVFIDNIAAIKHGMLGMVAEDNADTDRAAFHWSMCEQLMDDELRDYQKSARPVPEIKPFGESLAIPSIL